MASLGESEVIIQSRICGRMGVASLGQDPAVFPRLRIALRVALHEVKEGMPGAPTATAFELRDLAGELRLSQDADAVGNVVWQGQRRHVRSNDYGGDTQLTLTCDLDAVRIERIEQRRAGAPLRLWLALWPTLVANGAFLDADVRPISVDVPRDVWLAFLEGARGVSYEVFELALPQLLEPQLEGATRYLETARRRLDAGDYESSVVTCRKAIEAVRLLVPKVDEGDPLAAFLEERTPERHAEHYTGILSRLKQITAKGGHASARGITFSRPEALFILGTTVVFVSFVASLLAGTEQTEPGVGAP